jgi:hypothetical protein
VKQFLFLAGAILIGYTSQAQNQYEFWSKLNVTKEINRHWEAATDIQYRRQSNYLSGAKNIFQYNLTFSLRTWVYYKLPGKWTLVSSPIGYFKDETLKNERGDLGTTNELRSMLGFSKGYTAGKLLSSNRILYEFTFFNYTSPKMILRHRYRLFNSLEYPIKRRDNNRAVDYYLSNEIFYKTQNGLTSFDQNHLFNGIKWKWRTSELIMGYQYAYQKSKSIRQNKNQFLVTLNVLLPTFLKNRNFH